MIRGHVYVLGGRILSNDNNARGPDERVRPRQSQESNTQGALRFGGDKLPMGLMY